MVPRTRSVATAVALGALAASAGLALATNDGDGDGTPRTDPVRARFLVTESEIKVRTCQGKDGPYVEVKAEVKGPSTGDPRLRGAVQAHVRDFFNLNNGNGTFRGRLVVSDTRTGRVKVQAKFSGVDYRVGGEDETAGLIRGEARGKKARNLPGGELLANFRLAFPQGSPPVVQIGGAWSNNLIPAVIQRGRCTGRFHRAPEAASSPASRAVAARWGVAR
jgi:hypothetical protein